MKSPLPLIFLLMFRLLPAQYSLTETGVRIGGGVSLPLFSNGMQPGPGYGVDGFFSHYVCGKRYGYHGTLGLRGMQMGVKNGSDATEGRPGSIQFTSLDLGVYFKIRPHEYHRPVETAFLVGLKGSLITLAKYRNDSLAGRLRDEAGFSLNEFTPGIHLSAWYKRRLGQQAFYLQPGLEFYPFPVIRSAGGKLAHLQLFLGAGITLWNSKQKRRSKG